MNAVYGCAPTGIALPASSHPKGVLHLDTRLSLDAAAAVARGEVSLRLAPEARARCRASAGRLAELIGQERLIYGITTGFGPLAGRTVTIAETAELQQNLVYHLASGVGPLLSWDAARAMVLARLMSVLQGFSGASDAAIDAMLALLASDFAPAVPSQGTVGASGDLTPLAHMVLAFQGMGAFIDRAGARLDGPAGPAALGIPPLTLEARDGLALVNGTSAMTGIALLNAVDARRVLDWAVALSAALAEVLGGRLEAWHPAFADVRPHAGQRAVTRALAARLAGATLPDRSFAVERRVTSGAEAEAVPHQDAYTLRCVPQVLGAVADTFTWHESVVATELMSVTDNPIFPAEGPAALHGGNFMGQHVGLASDATMTAVIVMAGLGERQIARLTDEKLNGGLPPFLTGGRAGLSSGLMGAQVTATALLAELRAAATPVSAQSISTNGSNQDVVSMGTIAARGVRAGLDTCVKIEAILAIAVAAGLDIVEARRGSSPGVLSPSARTLREFVRHCSAPLLADRPLGDEIETLAAAMLRSDLPGLAPGDLDSDEDLGEGHPTHTL